MNLSESTIKDIMKLVESKITSRLSEGDIIDFEDKRLNKTLDKNAHEIARMVRDGELNNVRCLQNGELLGPAERVQKVKKLENESKECIRKLQKKRNN